MSGLVELAFDYWWETDSALRYTFVSPRFEELFGIPVQRLIGRRRDEIVDDDPDSPSLLAHLEDLRQRRTFRDFATWVVDADGVRRPVAVNGKPVFDKAGAFQGYVGFGRDLSELYRKQAEVEEANFFFATLFERAPLPMFIYDVASLRFLKVNDAAVTRYGHPENEFLQLTLLDIRPPEERIRLKAALQGPRGNGVRSAPWKHLTRAGEILDVEVSTQPIRFGEGIARLAIIVDNTTRNKALRQAERVLETAQDLVVVTSRAGRIKRISPSVQRILGVPPEQMIGKMAETFLSGADRPALDAARRAAHKGQPIRDLRTTCLHSDGSPRTIVWSGVWSDADQRFYMTGHDMTESERTQALLQAARRMEAVGQLTGGVAHDFNNVLMTIIANLEDLEEMPGMPAGSGERISRLYRAAERAGGLTRQLLAFARKQTLNPEPTSLNEMINDIGALLRRTLGAQIEVTTLLPEGIWPVQIDRGQMEAAIINLCINARDAMPAGGKLKIETRNVSLDGVALAENQVARGDYILVAITDQGSGIAPAHLEKVFEPFFTTKEAGRGTGLGLSMVYGFIRQSNGYVRIYSELGVGTCVKMYLPRAAGDAASIEKAAPLGLPRGTESILLVEDDAAVRNGIQRQLESLGYRVALASSGDEALSAMASETYDLVLSDVVMPGRLTGKALADALAEKYPGTRLVFMSGYMDARMFPEGIAPSQPILGKPFTRADLARRLRTELDRPRPNTLPS